MREGSKDFESLLLFALSPELPQLSAEEWIRTTDPKVDNVNPQASARTHCGFPISQARQPLPTRNNEIDPRLRGHRYKRCNPTEHLGGAGLPAP